MIAMTAEKAYDVILELLENPEPGSAWVDAFNEAGLTMEDRSAFDEPELDGEGVEVSEESDAAFKTTDEPVATTSAHSLPWHAFIQDKKLYMASPPMIFKSAQVRMVLDILNPHRRDGDAHINVHVIPCNSEGKMLDPVNNANAACIITSPDAGPAMIFSVWDFVSREGIENAMKSGAVAKTWVSVVLNKVPCHGDLPESPEEAHALKMLDVYAQAKDLDNAIIEYRKLENWATTSTWSAKAATRYNKIRFYLKLRDNPTIHPREHDEYELRAMQHFMAGKKGKAFLSWLLNGKSLDGSQWSKIENAAEKEAYPHDIDRRLANNIRDRHADIFNEIAPGLGVAPRLVPEQFKRCVPYKPEITYGDTTSYMRELRGFLDDNGRAMDREGVHLNRAMLLEYKGKREYDLTGLVLLTRSSGSKNTGYNHIYYEEVLVVDTIRGRSWTFEYGHTGRVK